MIRDKFKNSSYFIQYNNEQIEGIQNFKNSFAKAKDGTTNKEIFADTIVLYYLDLFIASYSNNATKNELETIILELLPFLEFTELYDSYVEALWLLSVSYALDIDPSKLVILKQRIVENEYDDYLVSSILDEIFGGTQINKRFNWKRPYEKLQPVLDLKQNADIQVISNYLKKHWYSGHSDSSWYDTHKSDKLAYSGYWAFETAALVKMFGLDDSSLQGVEYYPYDILRMNQIV